MGFAPTYENSTKKFFKATVPKPNYKAELSLKKKAVQVHDLTQELSDYYSNVHGLIHIHIVMVKNLRNNIRCGWSIEERQRIAGTLIFTTCAPVVCICTC